MVVGTLVEGGHQHHRAELEAVLEKAEAEDYMHKESWENRLQDTWRGKDKGAEIQRRADLLGTAKLFAHRSMKELRMLALAMEHMEYAENELIFAEGDPPDGVYVLDYGSVAVHVKGIGAVTDLIETGSVFGEICLFVDTPRTASIVASRPTRCFRCTGAEALTIMEDSWGDRVHLEARAEYLGAIEFFSMLGHAELMVRLSIDFSIFHWFFIGFWLIFH